MAAGVILSGCASGPSIIAEPQYLAAAPEHAAEPAEPIDPYEKDNRAALENNQKFNTSVIYPIADAYEQSVPEPVRDAISNFTANLSEPAIVANQILQLRLKAAATTTGRFVVNSTVGLGGIMDVASTQNLPRQTGDFGQTLYVWGVRESPYLVLPVVGPTNVRDAIGNGIELVATSLPTGGILGVKLAEKVNSINNVGTILTPFSSLSKAGDMRELEKNSLDFYAMLRSVVDQKRQAELKQALAESALSPPSTPSEPDYATEAIMTLYSSPTLAKQATSLSKSRNAASADTGYSQMVVGPLTPATE